MTTSFLEHVSLFSFKSKDIHDIIQKNPCIVFIAGLIANQFLDDKNLVANTCQICMALSMAKIAKSYDEKIKEETKKKKKLVESSDDNDISISTVDNDVSDEQQSSSNNVNESDSLFSSLPENTFQVIDSGQQDSERPPVSEVETTNIIEAMVVNQLPVNSSSIHTCLPRAMNRGSPVTAVLVQEDPSELILNGMRPMSPETARRVSTILVDRLREQIPHVFQDSSNSSSSVVNRESGNSNYRQEVRS